MNTDPAAPGPAFRRRRIEINSPAGGGVMAAVEMGPESAPVDLVFCHANGFNALTYRQLLSPVAARGHRVLSIDMRGHGRSELLADPDDRGGNWWIFRDDLIGLLETLEAPPKVVAGHSMGGTAGVLASGARPDLVPSLVLFDPVLMPPGMAERMGPGGFRESPLAKGALRRRAVFDSREAAYAAYHGRGAFRTWPDAVLADYVADGFRDLADGTVTLSCAPAWESSNFSSHEHDAWSAFAAGSCPVRILQAEEASTANIEDRLDGLIADGRARVDRIPGTSHFLPMERPDLVERELLAALQARP